MSMPNPTNLQPGPNWYPDPQSPHAERYWDGTAWTAAVRPLPTANAFAVAPVPVRSTNTLSIIAIVLGVLSVLFLPIILGPVGLILAGIGKSKGESLATVAMVVAGVGMVLGFGLGILFAAAMA